MPSTYAHYRMGQEIRKMISGGESSIIENNSDLFNVGLHGPDLLFYYKPLKSNPINGLGNHMHEQPGCCFFERASTIVKQHQFRPDYLSYVYGFICHFALDVTCHGYIDEKIRQSGLSHGEIEVEFDRALMVMDGLDPVRQQLTNHIVVDREAANVIQDFYTGTTSAEIMKALKGMKFYNQLLVAPSKVKREFLYTLLKVSGNYNTMHGLIVNYEKNEQCDDSTRRLLTLYEGAKYLAMRLIREYSSYLEGKSELDHTYQYTFGSKLVREKENEERIYEIEINES